MEPFGEFRAELRHGQRMSMTANMNRDRKETPEPYKPIDFMNFVDKPAEKQMTAKEVNDIFKGFFGGG